MGRIADLNPEGGSPEFPGNGIALPGCRNHRIDKQSVKIGPYAQDVLRNGIKVPGCGSGEPAVFGLPRFMGILSSNHLGVDIGLGLVQLTDLFQVGRTDLPEIVPGCFPIPCQGFGDHDPGIVVTEDPCILLVSFAGRC